MNILIVDDMKENLYLLETILKADGYEVQSATNGEEALNLLRSNGFNMIISDILMPVMDGYQFCKKVKEDKALRDIPFIFYTATYTSDKDEEFALALGADKFVRKPMELDQFIQLVEDLIKDAETGKEVAGSGKRNYRTQAIGGAIERNHENTGTLKQGTGTVCLYSIA